MALKRGGITYKEVGASQQSIWSFFWLFHSKEVAVDHPPTGCWRTAHQALNDGSGVCFFSVLRQALESKQRPVSCALDGSGRV